MNARRLSDGKFVDGWISAKTTNGVTCVMNEMISDIKPSELYSDLSEKEIAEMMAECAKVDALFQSGQISTFVPHQPLCGGLRGGGIGLGRGSGCQGGIAFRRSLAS